MSKKIRLKEDMPPTSSPTPVSKPAQKRHSQPAGPKSTDPGTVDGRQNILHDFIMASKEINRVASTIEKTLAKVTSQQSVDDGLIPFIQDLGVFIEPNIVKLRDSIAANAYQELKKVTTNLLQVAREQKAKQQQSAQPAPQAQPQQPAPQAQPQAVENRKYSKQKSLKEVFGMFEPKKLKGGAPWPSKDVIEQIRLVNDASKTFLFGMANNPNKPAHGSGEEVAGTPAEHYIVIARWLFNGDKTLKATDTPRVEARWHRKDESLNKSLEELTPEDYSASWVIIQPKEYGGNKGWGPDEAGAEQVANAMKTTWAKWHSEENRGAARHGI
jgi:hypothetical protein